MTKSTKPAKAMKKGGPTLAVGRGEKLSTRKAASLKRWKC